MTNGQVKRAFSQRERGHSVNLMSDGTSLWSYHWWEIARWVDGTMILRKGQSYSTTTATKHRSGVYATDCQNANIETPVHKAIMEL